ncbi:THAP domain-containing protein 5-like isoform X1 [Cheilinus undulatus]|uniref:THAP domain-containing protein 5-like isoform X1 n=2 Tax=Cheilinus undulatus TaxID=241271 RepID=UPI001BD3F6A7|nr:THAP domain-containing protein 5-like isoform X1 [Cheilinus undulatus]
MPRYCAVKFCRNRGGAAAKQDSKRISFYPFPLQDKPRLQKWVDNMKRDGWTPSRHQYLCSEHFTEDCFDIRWGIRYLKNTAIPTIFSSTEDDDGTQCGTLKRSPKAKPRTLDIDSIGFDSPVSKRPLILSRTCKKVQSSTTNNLHNGQTESVNKPPLVSDTDKSWDSNSSEIQTPVCKTSGDSGVQAASGLALSLCSKEEQTDSTVTVLCYETLGCHAERENVDATALQAALSQTFSLVPMEIIKDKPMGCFSEERGPSEGEHISVYEHAYCRQDTDKDQLWSKIMSLHAKISELDRREESTVAKIRALETEIALLRKDGAVFKEKQKVLEDYISSVLL